MDKIVRSFYNEYFRFAKLVSQSSTCPRAKIGAVAVLNGIVVSAGWNGSEECEKNGCYLVNNHCINAVHAEIRLICIAAKEGRKLNNAVMYLYDNRNEAKICVRCFNALKTAGINMCYFEGKNNILVKPDISYD